MKYLYRAALVLASASFFIASAQAQNSGSVSNHAVPVGKGPGVSGFTSVAPGATGRLLASNGASSDPSFQALPTVINSACTISPSLCAKAFGFYSPYWFGAMCDGSTDDRTALQSAVTAAAGGVLRFPAGTCVTSGILFVSSNTVIRGAGRDVSVVKQTGTNVTFFLSEVSTVEISDLWLLGVDAVVSWATGPTGGVLVANSTVQSNYILRNLRLSGFNTNYWIQFNAVNAAGNNSNIVIDNVWLNTAVADATPSGQQNYGIVIWSGSGAISWNNVSVRNVQIDGAALCFGIMFFGPAHDVTVANNRISNIGGANTNSHCTNGVPATNTYAISIYDYWNDGNPATNVLIKDNDINGSLATGIYMVGSNTATRAANSVKAAIVGNVITNVTYSDTALARGAIGVSNVTDVLISGNTLLDNKRGLDIEGQQIGDINVLSNYCYTAVASANCLNLVSGANGSSNLDHRIIRGNHFQSPNAINFTSATGSRFNDVDVSANAIIGTTSGLVATSQFFSGILTITGNSFRSTSFTPWALGSITGNVSLMSNTFYDSGTSATGIPLASVPAAVNGSQVFVSDGAPASSPCTSASTGSTASRQNGAWKCF